MNDTEMLKLLQMFFDGNITRMDDVKGETGLNDEDATKVFEAIQRLRSMKIV